MCMVTVNKKVVFFNVDFLAKLWVPELCRQCYWSFLSSDIRRCIMDDWCPMFRENLVISPWRIKSLEKCADIFCNKMPACSLTKLTVSPLSSLHIPQPGNRFCGVFVSSQMEKETPFFFPEACFTMEATGILLKSALWIFIFI